MWTQCPKFRVPDLGRLRLGLVSVLTLLLTVCAAGLAAHFAIDALGDVALQRDAYDGLAHASRGAAVVCALTCALAAAFRLLWTAVDGGGERLSRALGRLVPRSPIAFVVLTVCGAAAAVAGMETFDAFSATGRIVDVADAFGGSLSFGLGLEMPIAALVAWTAWRALHLIADSRDAIVRAVAALFVVGRRARTIRFDRRRAERLGESRDLFFLSRRAGRRGPPLSHAFCFSPR
jgi:hypothetical protein